MRYSHYPVSYHQKQNMPKNKQLRLPHYPPILRKVFNYADDSQYSIVEKLNASGFAKPVSAAGCILYRIHNYNELQLLLITYSSKSVLKDDFGGKVDLDDRRIINCIARETAEETNNVITRHKTKQLIYDGDPFKFYNAMGKYAGYAIQVDNEFDDADFGDIEYHDNLERTIGWFNYKNVKHELAFRLSSSHKLIKFFDKIAEMLDID
jgi:ADP-ribose pyrophosphatase YjhB (NUDIX family)